MIDTVSLDRRSDPDGRASGPKRVQAVEALRILSAFGIVYFHYGNPAGHDIAYAGLIVFVALSAYFGAMPGPSTQRRLASLAARLLIPFAFWSLVFAAFNLVRHKPVLQAGLGPVQAVLLGTSPHLWYLPFIVVAVALTRAMRTVLSLEALGRSATAVAIGLLLAVEIWRPASTGWGHPWDEYAHAVPPFLFGLCLAIPSASAWRLALIVTVTAVLIVVLVLEIPGVSVPYAIGFAAVLLAVEIGDRIWPFEMRINRFSRSMFGVYLIHPLFVAVIRPGLQGHPLAGSLVVFATSSLTVVAIGGLASRFASPRLAGWLFG